MVRLNNKVAKWKTGNVNKGKAIHKDEKSSKCCEVLNTF